MLIPRGNSNFGFEKTLRFKSGLLYFLGYTTTSNGYAWSKKKLI